MTDSRTVQIAVHISLSDMQNLYPNSRLQLSLKLSQDLLTIAQPMEHSTSIHEHKATAQPSSTLTTSHIHKHHTQMDAQSTADSLRTSLNNHRSQTTSRPKTTSTAKLSTTDHSKVTTPTIDPTVSCVLQSGHCTNSTQITSTSGTNSSAFDGKLVYRDGHVCMTHGVLAGICIICIFVFSFIITFSYLGYLVWRKLSRRRKSRRSNTSQGHEHGSWNPEQPDDNHYEPDSRDHESHHGDVDQDAASYQEDVGSPKSFY